MNALRQKLSQTHSNNKDLSLIDYKKQKHYEMGISNPQVIRTKASMTTRKDSIEEMFY